MVHMLPPPANSGTARPQGVLVPPPRLCSCSRRLVCYVNECTLRHVCRSKGTFIDLLGAETTTRVRRLLLHDTRDASLTPRRGRLLSPPCDCYHARIPRSFNYIVHSWIYPKLDLVAVPMLILFRARVR